MKNLNEVADSSWMKNQVHFDVFNSFKQDKNWIW